MRYGEELMLEIYEKLKTGIVGREAEIRSILVALEMGKHILLEGPPGTSKSTVLRKIAREFRSAVVYCRRQH